ncbi:DeoR/GlpR family DNA-binding transcription regulator [Chitinophaga pendula]|uniref:DeoR/GlpR family DNA-binding transcription regulator n=1 Tax=Chitinophaga TaxID=79328 RepID=UPI000BB0A362|nr:MULTISPECIES: DeoR/GlpR family DNA-binding transcription regulator [Chitinophaga]ASZ13831.1 DeoR family transcriptional regulator [Chitinophaga sp. MD30]UCJ08546.1 DeoR/GlpR family DNA-binding transcription regulator [Chitinophaga pendula]
MAYPDRKLKILQALADHTHLEVQELSALLDISPVTIRRDLQQMAEEGLLLRTHGGAMKHDQHIAFTAFADKSKVAAAAKEEIGKLAATHVQEGDTIFLDCGSTVFAMCEHLKKIKNLRIITNSLPVMAAFMDTPQIMINLAGGELDRDRRAIHGQQAIQHINSYHAQKAFIGTDGLSIAKGLSANSEKEASMSKAMAVNADQVFLLCDASKIGKDSYFAFAPLHLIHHLISDASLSTQQRKILRSGKVNILS